MKEAHKEYILAEEREFLGKEVGNWFIPPEKEIAGYESIKVELLAPLSKSSYEEWVNAAYYSSLVTWDTTPHIPISKGLRKSDFKEKEKRLMYILKQRPISVALEGIVFTFKLTGVPRAFTHQFVRHRQMSFGQQSYRVSSCYSDPIRMPMALNKVKPPMLQEIMTRNFINVVKNCRKMYKELIDNGIPMEQARNIMPMGTCTKIAASMRLRDLIDYVKGRTSDITQDEHTFIVCKMLIELKEKQPKFFKIISLMAPNILSTLKKYRV